MAFLDELRRYGFVEGQNLIVDQRGFSTDYNKFPEVAAAPPPAAEQSRAQRLSHAPTRRECR